VPADCGDSNVGRRSPRANRPLGIFHFVYGTFCSGEFFERKIMCLILMLVFLLADYYLVALHFDSGAASVSHMAYRGVIFALYGTGPSVKAPTNSLLFGGFPPSGTSSEYLCSKVENIRNRLFLAKVSPKHCLLPDKIHLECYFHRSLHFISCVLPKPNGMR
jgi:hypothetical protein